MVRLILAALAVVLATLAGIVGYRTYTFTAPPCLGAFRGGSTVPSALPPVPHR